MDCIFCDILAGKIPCYKVYEDEHILAFLDIMPAARGHTLVIPKTHVAGLEDIPPDMLAQTVCGAQTVAHILRSRLEPDGINMVQNNGVAAGQVVFHYHLHLMPRWYNDHVSLQRRGETDHDALAALAHTLQA